MPSSPGATPARGYADLHDHVARLDAEGLLVRVTRPINKDTELHPLVRWQFRGGIPEPERKAFLFEHVTDSKGRRYGMPVVVGALAANRRIYSLGIGCYTAVQKLPPDVEEFHVAGGLAGAPLRVVRCKTVDLTVPAEAEIVVEGLIDTEWLEPEGPVGESHGYVNLQEFNPFMEVTAITYRQDAILPSIISQVTPSESSLIKKVAYEPLLLHHLQQNLAIRSVVRVGMHEPLTNLRKVVVVQMRAPAEREIWQALYGAASFQPAIGKLVVAVDEDIDPENPDAVLWAMSYRMNPQYDVQILKGKDPGHGPRPTRGRAAERDHSASDSALLINAIRKQPFPPISLPAREYMERAKAIWEELGLPRLTPESPWHGYSLGEWCREFEEEATLAAQGDAFLVGERLARRRIKGEMPNKGAWPEDEEARS